MLLCPLLAYAEVTESLEFQDYVVRADGERSLTAAINRVSPIRQEGKVFHGFTKWHVRWNFYWNADGNGTCRMTRTKVVLSGTILLPKLVGGAGSQRDQFEAYIKNLRTHELGHYEIGKRAAKAIDAYLLTLPARSSCAALETEANAGAYRLLRKHNEIEAQYDRDTGHGRSQGAWLSN